MTSPEDYVFNTTTVEEDFFGENGDCCYVLFGRPTGVRRVRPRSRKSICSPSSLRPAVRASRHWTLRTSDARTRRRVAPISQGASARTCCPAEGSDSSAERAGQKPAGEQPAVLSSKRLAAPAVLTPSKEPGSGPTPASPAQDGRLPIPDEISQQLARRVLRKAHQRTTRGPRPTTKEGVGGQAAGRARSPDTIPSAAMWLWN